MMQSLFYIEDYRIFAAVKTDDGYDVSMLPQPLSISYNTLFYGEIINEYIIEWSQEVSKALLSDRSNFLIIYRYNATNKKIDTEVLHKVSFDYSGCSCGDVSEPIIYRYRCSVKRVFTPNEKALVRIMNDFIKQKANELFGKDINLITVDELQNESDNMTNTFMGFSSVGRRTLVILMPTITDIYYNDPHTTVKWSDGTTTTVAATSGEEFNKELGLAMAMSRKYCECMGLEHPRAGFKRMVNNAHDQTEKTAARKAYKNSKKLLKAADVSTEKDNSDGHSTDL